jgi:hypothetical protein
MNHRFELDDWPNVNTDPRSFSMPYHGSVFDLKGKYKQVFYNIQNKPDGKSQKFYKIKYSVNFLPAATFVNGQSEKLKELMESLSSTEELTVFDTDIVRDFIEYQWITYAKSVHLLGGFNHFIYCVVICFYMNDIYNYRDFTHRINYLWTMLALLLYPMIYDGIQLFYQGPREYFSDSWNFIDQGHIWFGIANVFMQRFTPDILNKNCTTILIISLMISTMKTFFFLRIFKSLSFLVSMLSRVTQDLIPFFIFFIILLISFA